MVSENVIGLAELESAWNATRKGDTETKLAIYKLFSNLSIHFKEEQIEFIIEKISEIEPSEMIPDEIELVYELSRFSSKSSTYTNKAKEFFWKIICDPENLYPTEIREPALYKFCYIMRSWDLIEERVTVLYDCVENIKNVTHYNYL